MKTTTDIGSQLKHLRTRITHANGLSWTALVLALTGSAFANHLQVLSSDIVNGEVKTPDLATGAVTNSKIAASAVTGAKIAAGAVTGAKIADNAVTGAKIAESTLGIVPNADKLDGMDSTSFVVGPGRVVSGYRQIVRGTGSLVLVPQVAGEIGLNILAICPSGDQLVSSFLQNLGPSTLDAWVQQDLTSSELHSRVAPQNAVAFANGDAPGVFTFHLGDRLSNWHATIYFQTVADKFNCHTFVQVITSG